MPVNIWDHDNDQEITLTPSILPSSFALSGLLDSCKASHPQLEKVNLALFYELGGDTSPGFKTTFWEMCPELGHFAAQNAAMASASKLDAGISQSDIDFCRIDDDLSASLTVYRKNIRTAHATYLSRIQH